MFRILGQLVTQRPWLVCFAWIALGLSLALMAPSWDSRAQDDDIRFLPARCDSVRGYHLLAEAFPQDIFASKVVLVIERADSDLTAADRDFVENLGHAISALGQAEPKLQLKNVLSPADPLIGSRLMSEDRRCALIQVSLGTPYLALRTVATVERVEALARQVLAEQGPEGLQLAVTGPAGVGRDLVKTTTSSLDATTVATLLLVVAILLFVYRAPALALVPLVSIAACVWVVLSSLALCTLIPGFYLVNITAVFAVVMLYGAGTDYCLFLISRYREELARGTRPATALARAVVNVGGALTASAATVVCGLGMMATAEFAKVRTGGPAIGLSLIVALAAALTLTPALLQILGTAAFWPVGAPQPEADGRPRRTLWTRLARVVVRRPLTVGLVAVLVLIPLAILGFQVRPSYRATAELSSRATSVRGLEALKRHFTPGEVGPITLLLVSPQEWDGDEGRSLIRILSATLSGMDNVAEVRSLTQPLGKPLPVSAPQLPGMLSVFLNKLCDPARAAARAHYTATLSSASPPKYVTRLDVVLRSDPFDPVSMKTLELIQGWLGETLPAETDTAAPTSLFCYGITVSARDMAQTTEADRLRLNTLVLIGIFLILLLLVRKVWLAGFLLGTVLLSYYTTLGATTIFATLCHGRPLYEVDWRVPFFLFVTLVAVGEDYNILLISRALYERKRHGAVKAMRRALGQTGGTITSCGLIMAGTCATLMLSGLSTLVQIGFALMVGVLLDTFIVRPLLVPSLTLWMWQREEEETVVEKSRRRIIPIARIYRAAG
jgi:RND superfamily putative drug exporter